MTVNRSFNLRAINTNLTSNVVTSGLVRQQHTSSVNNLVANASEMRSPSGVIFTVNVSAGDPDYTYVLLDNNGNTVETIGPTASTNIQFTPIATSTFPVGTINYSVRVTDDTGDIVNITVPVTIEGFGVGEIWIPDNYIIAGPTLDSTGGSVPSGNMLIMGWSGVDSIRIDISNDQNDDEFTYDVVPNSRWNPADFFARSATSTTFLPLGITTINKGGGASAEAAIATFTAVITNTTAGASAVLDTITFGTIIADSTDEDLLNFDNIELSPVYWSDSFSADLSMYASSNLQHNLEFRPEDSTNFVHRFEWVQGHVNTFTNPNLTPTEGPSTFGQDWAAYQGPSLGTGGNVSVRARWDLTLNGNTTTVLGPITHLVLPVVDIDLVATATNIIIGTDVTFSATVTAGNADFTYVLADDNGNTVQTIGPVANTTVTFTAIDVSGFAAGDYTYSVNISDDDGDTVVEMETFTVGGAVAGGISGALGRRLPISPSGGIYVPNILVPDNYTSGFSHRTTFTDVNDSTNTFSGFAASNSANISNATSLVGSTGNLLTVVDEGIYDFTITDTTTSPNTVLESGQITADSGNVDPTSDEFYISYVEVRDNTTYLDLTVVTSYLDLDGGSGNRRVIIEFSDSGTFETTIIAGTASDDNVVIATTASPGGLITAATSGFAQVPGSVGDTIYVRAGVIDLQDGVNYTRVVEGPVSTFTRPI